MLTWEKRKISNLTLHIRELEDETKVSGIMEVTKSRNEIQIKNTVEKTKLVLLKDKIDKLLVRLTKREGEMAQINKIRNKRGDLTTYTTEIQRVMRDHYE